MKEHGGYHPAETDIVDGAIVRLTDELAEARKANRERIAAQAGESYSVDPARPVKFFAYEMGKRARSSKDEGRANKYSITTKSTSSEERRLTSL